MSTSSDVTNAQIYLRNVVYHWEDTAKAREALESIARGEGTTTKGTNQFNLVPLEKLTRKLQQRHPLNRLLPFQKWHHFCVERVTAAWKGHRPECAIANFTDALKLCPHLWEAFEGLCALGMNTVKPNHDNLTFYRFISSDKRTLLPPR